MFSNMIFMILLMLNPLVHSAMHGSSHFEARRRLEDSETKVRHERSATVGCPDNGVCNFSSPYRNIDGRCNNINNPTWGSVNIVYRRFIAGQFREDLRLCKDNTNTPKCQILPKARDIVVALHLPECGKNKSRLSVMHMEWGQVISHDINDTPTEPGLTCCVDCSSTVTENPQCLPMDVSDDPFFDQFNISCLENSRSLIADFACTGGSREQINKVTAYIDASILYSTIDADALNLRTMTNGKMKVFENVEVIPGSCPSSTVSSCPFTLLPMINNNTRILAGDGRAAQQPALTSMHHFLIRMHNDFATRFKIKYSNYSDEEIYQKSRRVVIALMQHITYNEYLPALLSDSAMNFYGLKPTPSGYFTKYNSTTDASLHNAFSGAAFRFGHSTVTDVFKMSNNGELKLSESFITAGITYNNSSYPSQIINGISAQQSEELDESLVKSLTNFLFARPPFNFGGDLYSRNILRGRDHFIPPYTKWRTFCGLTEVKNFGQLKDVMKRSIAKKFKDLYNCIDQIDLYPALLAENPVNDGEVGPTLECLLGKQFKALKEGDRFYYENDAPLIRFTQQQLESIKRTTLAAAICRLTKTSSVPLKVMEALGSGNSIQDCSTIIPNTVMTQFDTLW